MAAATTRGPLRVAVLLGSTRTDGPPLPAPLGRRVGLFVESQLLRRGHTVDCIDPANTEHALPLLRRPHFTYPRGKAPPPMDELAAVLEQADAYVAVTPEYNHAPSPALLNIFNHFGSSTFGFKPSAIVSYSQGQWGGTRAAHALRPTLSELGCLPVSAMIHVPRAHQQLNDDGTPVDNVDRWEAYAGRTLGQLEWWAEAARGQRGRVDPERLSPALRSNPAQRNAP